MSEKVISRMYMLDEEVKKLASEPKIGFINCDGRQHLELLSESLFMG